MSHTNAHAIRGRPTLKPKAVQRNFRHGPFHESLSNDSKLLTTSHEIKSNIQTNSNVPSIILNYNTTDKTIKTDCIHVNSEMMKSDSPEIKNLYKQRTYEDHKHESNKKAAILDLNKLYIDTGKGQQQVNLVNPYLKSFLLVNIWILLSIFTVLSTYKKTFTNVFIMFVVCLQLIISVVFFSVVYIVQGFSNIFNDCHILEKTIKLCNINIYNDVVVSIKVQKCRSRYAKYLYYNCNRVVCACHANHRERDQPNTSQQVISSLSEEQESTEIYMVQCT